MPPRSSDASVLGRACSSRKSEKVSGTKIFWKIKEFGPAPCRATFPSSKSHQPSHGVGSRPKTIARFAVAQSDAAPKRRARADDVTSD